MTSHPHPKRLGPLSRLLEGKSHFIWDFDGSLCDTEPLHYAAYAASFARYGHVVREEEYYRRFTQSSEGIREEVEAYGLALDAEACRDIRAFKVREYATIIASGAARCFAEMPEILATTLRLGLTWSIASNSPESENRLILDGLGAPFDSFVSLVGPAAGGQHGLRKKPAPDLFDEVLRRVAVDRGQALVIEDTDKGLQAAEAAGIDAICLVTKYNDGITMTARHVARVTHAEFLGALRELERSRQKE